MSKSPRLQIVPKAKRSKINELYIAVTQRGNGEEIYSIVGPGGEELPLVAIDRPAVAILKDFSQGEANKNGKDVEIIRFTRSALHATVRPLSSGD